MNHPLLCFFLIILSIYAFPSFSQDIALIGDYESKDLQTGTRAEVSIYHCQRKIFISWSLSLHPEIGVEVGAVSLASEDSRGRLSFKFEDAWGNKGNGLFKRVKAGYALQTWLVYRDPFGEHVVDHYGTTWNLDKVSNYPNGMSCPVK